MVQLCIPTWVIKTLFYKLLNMFKLGIVFVRVDEH